MKRKLDIDTDLRCALGETRSPNAQLINKTKQRMEETQMKKRFIGKSAFIKVAIAAALILALGISAFALLTQYTPAEIALILDRPQLAKALREGKGTIINKSQTSGNYVVTLIGIASAEDLAYMFSEDDAFGSGSMALLSVARKDGQPMPPFTEREKTPFGNIHTYVLFDGYVPWQVCIGAGGSATILDGVEYQAIEYDEIECFAGRKVHLFVTDTNPGSDNLTFDTKDISIRLKPDYAGVSLLFELPLDPAKADAEKAHRFVQESTGQTAQELEEGKQGAIYYLTHPEEFPGERPHQDEKQTDTPVHTEGSTAAAPEIDIDKMNTEQLALKAAEIAQARRELAATRKKLRENALVEEELMMAEVPLKAHEKMLDEEETQVKARQEALRKEAEKQIGEARTQLGQGLDDLKDEKARSAQLFDELKAQTTPTQPFEPTTVVAP